MIPPRIRYAPPSLTSLGQEAVELGESYGVYLDDWQQYGLDMALGLRDDGKWSAFEFGMNVARQNGKNEVALVRELAGLFLLGPSGFPVAGPKRCRDGEMLQIHSAHEFKTSMEHMRRVEEIVQANPDLHAKVKGGQRGYRHSHGEEGIEFRSGQRIRFMTRTSGSGRGHTGDLVVLDEAMILADAFIGTLLPTMSARSILGNPQLWYLFTAVDLLTMDHGIVAARLRARARRGGDPSLAYLEWSARIPAAEAEDRDPTPDDVDRAMAVDRDLWRQANPALGIRISEEHIEKEQRSMPARQFSVERLGVGEYPNVDEDGVPSVIDLAAWDDLEDPKSKPRNPVCFAFDLSPMRTWGSIAVAGYRGDGLPHVEVIEHREGTGWIPERLAELGRKHRPVAIGYGKDSPAESLLPDIEKRHIRNVEALSVAEHAAACGRIFDAVEQLALKHMGDQSPNGPALRDAIASAVQKHYGDKWLWARSKSPVDISPLVSVTLALYLLNSRVRAREPMIAFA